MEQGLTHKMLQCSTFRKWKGASFCLLFACLILIALPSYANNTYFTDTDNEDNAGTQVADNDLDVLVQEPDAIHPIEFNIDMTGALPASSATLTINAFDVDEEAFELDEVYINGNLLGTLYGESSEDRTTIFSVPTNLIVAGNNLVEILVDPDGWSLRVNWGQLLIDGGSQSNAELVNSQIAAYTADVTNTTIDVDVDIDINTTGDFRVEVNLVDFNNHNISVTTEDFSATAGDQLNNTYQLTYPTSSFTGSYRVEVLLFYDNGAFNVNEEVDQFTYQHVQTIGPSLPASALYSTITANNFAVTADGVTPTIITIQGIDTTLGNTGFSGQAVTLNTTAGTLGPVIDQGDGTYTSTLTAAANTSTATITGTIDGVDIVDTATVSFLPGPPSRFTTTIDSTAPTLEANGLSSTNIIVQTIDDFGNNLTQGGNSVTLSTTLGTLSAVSDLGNGSYVATLTSETTIGTAIVSGLLNGASITETAGVNFVVGPADRSNTSVTASLPEIYADGVTESVITVQTIDLGGNPLSTGGDIVNMGANYGLLGASTDNGDGTYTARLRSILIPGTAFVSASLNGLLVNDTASVNFVPIPTVIPQNANTATPAISGTLELISGASFAVNVNNRNYVLGDGNLTLNGSVWSLQIPLANALTEGTYSVTATVTDAAGQITSDSSSDELFLDLTPPTLTLDPLPQATGLNILEYDISGTCSAFGDVFTLTITDSSDRTIILNNQNCPDGSFTRRIDLFSLGDGLLDVEIQIFDTGGNSVTRTGVIDKDACIPSDVSTLCDEDKDGIPNGVEEILGTDPDTNDSDGDGISDEDEFGGNFENPPDTDGDGIIDALDLDSDNDGIFDIGEIGADPANPRDTDGDGIPDYKDRDSDGDFVPDAVEFAYFVRDPDEDGFSNHIDLDSDADGIPDSIENGVAVHSDQDGDGIDDAFDVTNTGGTDSNGDGVDDAIRLLDTDGDSRFNMFDIDSDNDGISGRIESGLAGVSDSDGDGIIDTFDVDATGQFDNDGDGVDDAVFPIDSDGDGVPNYLDLDSDNDSQTDIKEAGGTDNVPPDGMVDNLDDQGQITPQDTDGDGAEDFLDLESTNPFNDGSGPYDISANPNSPLVDANDDGVVDNATDRDGDGVADTVDESEFGFGSNEDHDQDGISNFDDLDDDNDGIPDSEEGDGAIDSDGDGVADSADPDSDNDGITDISESGSGLTDADGDGRIDNVTDQNGDGLDDNVPANSEPQDTDGDGIPDYQDTDSDGDGVNDLNEVAEGLTNIDLLDSDGDGRIDSIDNTGSARTFFDAIDSDGDGAPDHQDVDSDNDGLTDLQESVDSDGDGVTDRVQASSGQGLETAIEGAGALDWPTLLLLVIFFIHIYRQNNAKHYSSQSTRKVRDLC